jgi:hypothetical protein
MTSLVARHSMSAARMPAELLARALTGDLSWVTSDSWELSALVRSAEHHGISGLLWQVLHLRADRPAGFIEQLSGRVHADIAREAVRARDLSAVTRALEERQIPALLIKGAALAYTCYPHPWLRPRTDTDILVPRESVDAAAAVFLSLGYYPSAAISTGELVSHQIAYERRGQHGVSHVIDLHWKIVNPHVLADVLPFAEVWADARVVTRDTLVARVPSPVWCLLIACVHRLAHHQDQERLVWLHDMNLLARQFTRDDWTTFVALAHTHGISAVCAHGLEAASRLLGMPIPETVTAALNTDQTVEPSGAYTGRRRKLDVLRDDLRRLPWSDRVLLLREHAFPPASFMMSRYALHQRTWLPAFYIRRLVSGAWKWLRA